MSKLINVTSLLIDIESELRQLNLWEAESPPIEALASTEPFCIDTLSFPQWLQYVFLVRMYALVKQQQALPNNCNITPMAQEYFKGMGLNTGPLIMAIEALDQLLSE